ncbi:uncharacterized protein LOC144450172 isoform X2 [Glandiceps talaboti]
MIMAKLSLYVLWTLFCISAMVKFSVLSQDVGLPGQTEYEDPHACPWFQLQDKSIYRCCDGFFKDPAANITTRCQECPSGQYGEDCQFTCLCNNGATCNNIDGSCHCRHGYYGTSCSLSCNCKNGATCGMFDGSCSCQQGFFGTLCENACSCPPNSVCDGSTGDCLCLEGYYGNQCSLRCDCPENSLCDPMDGMCTCKPGYFGVLCSQRCDCHNGAECGISDPNECACATGWEGDECTECKMNFQSSSRESYCQDKCIHCYNGDVCQPEDGTCHCTSGWQGNRCDTICDEGYHGDNCSEVCECVNGGRCNHVTGMCTCLPGWMGTRCEEACPTNCADCHAGMGICKSCRPGWMGVMCDEPCPLGYYGDGCQWQCRMCEKGYSCNHVDGSCQCSDGCGNICGCHNDAPCNVTSGECSCTENWSGQFCNISLSNEKKQNNKGFPSASGTSFVAWIAFIAAILIISMLTCVIVIAYTRTKDRKRREEGNKDVTVKMSVRMPKSISDKNIFVGIQGTEMQSHMNINELHIPTYDQNVFDMKVSPIYDVIANDIDSKADEDKETDYCRRVLGSFKSPCGDDQPMASRQYNPDLAYSIVPVRDEGSEEKIYNEAKTFDPICRYNDEFLERRRIREALYEELNLSNSSRNSIYGDPGIYGPADPGNYSDPGNYGSRSYDYSRQMTNPR